MQPLELMRGHQLGKRTNEWYAKVICPDCGKERWILKWKMRLKIFTGSCLRCNGIRLKNGGQMKSVAGYVFVFDPHHPQANTKGYVRRSRLILEKKLGRPLSPGCVTHHLNGKKDDDRPKNLVELNDSTHKKLHFFQQKLSREKIIAGRREVVEFLATQGDFWPSATRCISREEWQAKLYAWGVLA